MEGQKDISARMIAEELLDITGNALLSGNFEPFSAVFHLPHTMTTLTGSNTVTDVSHLHRIFDGVRDKLKNSGASEMARFIEAAEFRSPTQIASTHVTHMMAGGTQLDDPYPVFSIIEQIDGVWKIVSSDYAVKPRSPQESAILSSPTDTTTQE